MKLRPKHYIIAGQTILGVCLFVCLLITPGHFFSKDQGGVSNYGVENPTTGLYTTGLIAAAIGSLLAGLKLPSHISKQSKMRSSLFTLSVLYALSLISTYQYKHHPALHMLHYVAAITLFIGMLFIAAWLRFWAVPDCKTTKPFLLFCAGFLAAVLTFFGFLHILFAAQIVTGASFAYMLIHGVGQLDNNPPTSYGQNRDKIDYIDIL